MPYPSANDLYEVASMVDDKNGALVRAAADELVERRKASTGRAAEVRRVADEIGARGLIDLADDLRMLARTL